MVNPVNYSSLALQTVSAPYLSLVARRDAEDSTRYRPIFSTKWLEGPSYRARISLHRTSGGNGGLCRTGEAIGGRITTPFL